MDTELLTAGTAGVIVSALLQVAKNSPLFPWMSRNTGKLNVWISVVTALLSSAGILWSFDYNGTSGEFSGNFHGNVWDLWQIAKHTTGQWAWQHFVYKSGVVPAETLGEIRALLMRVLTPPPVSTGEAKEEASIAKDEAAADRKRLAP